MPHFDYDQFLRQRGLAATKARASSPSKPSKPQPAPAATTTPPQPKIEDEFFDYDVPTCDWRPGASEAFCGEGVICPPCG